MCTCFVCYSFLCVFVRVCLYVCAREHVRWNTCFRYVCPWLERSNKSSVVGKQSDVHLFALTSWLNNVFIRARLGQYLGTVNAHRWPPQRFCVPCVVPDVRFSSLQFSRPTFFPRLSNSVKERKLGRGCTSPLRCAFISGWRGTVFLNCQQFVLRFRETEKVFPTFFP